MKEKEKLIHYSLLLVLLMIVMLGGLFVKSYGQTKDSVRLYLEEIGCKEIDIVMQQAILETGHFKSYSSRVRHNLFGLTRNHKLETFDNWKQSCDKYLLWIQYKYDNRESYYDFLLRIGYATDENYIELLKSINV